MEILLREKKAKLKIIVLEEKMNFENLQIQKTSKCMFGTTFKKNTFMTF